MPLPEAILIITIDVEEDNWGIHRSGLTVENVKEINRLQVLFDRYGIKPTYLLSYQVASCDWAVNILAKILAEGKCEIGAHLHPWNTPPLKETLSERNSMLLNLPYELQKEKLLTLTDQIEKAFGTKPQSFRAGRWGLGKETIDAIIACDYQVDSSVTPMMSWTSYGDGPEYREARTEPYWLSIENNQRNEYGPHSILEVPVSIGFNRWPFELCQKSFHWLENKWLRFLHPIGILYHTNLLRKIWLSPEASSADKMIDLSKLMIRHGKWILNLTFHSNALLPGKGPFIKNEKELKEFYLKLEKYFDYLTSNTNLVPLTLSEVHQLLESKKYRNNYIKRIN